MRTLQDSGNRTERKTALLANELARYSIDIAALSETRLAGEDQMTEIESGYTLFWSGKPEEEKRESGVGFAVKTSLLDKIERPTAINERIISLRVPLIADRYMTIISVYAPTLNSSDELVMSFYQALGSFIAAVPKEESLVLLGDFNARVGNEHNIWKPLGPHGIGKSNSNGLMLLQLCSQFDLVITNTFFHQKKEHKATWFHPRSKNGHMIDFIVTRRGDLRSFCKVRVMRGADCDTDHMMVRAKLRVNIRRKIRPTGVKVPKRIDVSKLKDSVTREAFTSSCDALDLSECSWDDFKKLIFDNGSDVLGLKMTRQRDWFNDNSDEINALLEEKRVAHRKLLNCPPCDLQGLNREFCEVRRHVQRKLRQIKNQWWLDLSAEIQSAYNKKDTKTFYCLLRQAYGPKSSSVVAMKSKDNSSVLKNPNEIQARWTEHFSDLFHNPSLVDDAAVESVPQRPLYLDLNIEPLLAETIECINQVNTGKAPGLDGIPVELLIHGGLNVHRTVHSLILKVWRGHPVPQDWIDAILISLYKGKGPKSMCGSYRGISLLEAVGKVFARLLLNRLSATVCIDTIPESQSGFRPGRGTVDMIFSARQLVEKSIEQRKPLYQVFVDLTKAFDTVNRDALWKVLHKFGCPPDFVDKFRQLHRSMKARVNFNGQLSDEISVDNGVKQGDIPAPTLFSIYLTAVLWYAFHDCETGVYFRFRVSGKVFNLRRLDAKTLVSDGLVRELLYADDADLVSHSSDDMQDIMDRFADACTSFGLTISLDKTKVMYTPVPGAEYLEPDIYVYGSRLEVVESFVYLGSTLSFDGSLEAEIKGRICKASKSFGALEDRVWSDKSLTLNTKLTVYETCVITSLLYASETWTIYQRHIKSLERFHQNCFRHILSIKWQSCTPDTEVLSKAKCMSISARVIKSQMRWTGHLVRMDDSRLPKRLFYGELSSGKRPQHKPRKRFKDCVKANLKHMAIPVGSWEDSCGNRGSWRKLIHDGCALFESNRVSRAELRRACRKGVVALPDSPWSCNICNRVLLSKAGLVNHLKSHEPTNSRTVPVAPSTSHIDTGLHTCPTCTKLCKSAGGLKRHLRIHADVASAAITSRSPLQCHICQQKCKSLAGLKSHLRAHGRVLDELEGMALV